MLVLCYQKIEKRSVYSKRTTTAQDLDQYTLIEQSMHNIYGTKNIASDPFL